MISVILAAVLHCIGNPCMMAPTHASAIHAATFAGPASSRTWVAVWPSWGCSPLPQPRCVGQRPSHTPNTSCRMVCIPSLSFMTPRHVLWMQLWILIMMELLLNVQFIAAWPILHSWYFSFWPFCRPLTWRQGSLCAGRCSNPVDIAPAQGARHN